MISIGIYSVLSDFLNTNEDYEVAERQKYWLMQHSEVKIPKRKTIGKIIGSCQNNDWKSIGTSKSYFQVYTPLAVQTQKCG